MAKKSSIARDLKRRKMHEQYAAKRAELKAAGDLEGLHKFFTDEKYSNCIILAVYQSQPSSPNYLTKSNWA